jgi:PPP family 3-phenylpropionic acid transporter
MTTIRMIFLCIGAAAGFLYPYSAVIFAGRGLSAAAIGLVTALGAAGGILAGPAWGHVGDVVTGRRRALGAALLGAAGALVVFGLPAPAAVGAIGYILFMLAADGHSPLLDALTVNALRIQRNGDYGRIRLFTSLAYAVTAIGSGLVFDFTGYWPAPFLAAAMFAIAAVLARGIRDVPRAQVERGSVGRRGGAVRAALAFEPRLPIVYATFALGGMGVTAVLTFMPIRIVEVGGSPSQVALASGLDAIAEILGLLATGWLARGLGLRGLYLGAMALMATCMASLVAMSSAEAIIVARTLMGFSFAGLIVAGVMTVAALLPPDLQATGQALGGVLGGTAAIIANLGGGLLYSSAGASTLFAVCATITAIAGILGLAVLPRRSGARVNGVSRSTDDS